MTRRRSRCHLQRARPAVAHSEEEIVKLAEAGFQKQRINLARKLGNPRLLQIHFHMFRHWKATMEYHKTKDILHIMRLLGHKSIQNTLIYTQLIDLGEDSYTCKVALDIKEACEFLEAGFEYVTEMEGKKIFRKRK